jgi:lipopolysaccharide transport system permease protein
MSTNTSYSQSTNTGLPAPEQVFDWPQQAAHEQNWTEATRRWAVLRKAYPQHPVTWLQGAVAHMEAGELEQAAALLEHARNTFPNNPNTLTESAELAMREHEWNIADTLLKQAREEFPNHLQTWLKSAAFAENHGDIELADSYAETACDCAPDRPGPYILHAERAMRTKQWEAALSRWQTVRTKFPESPAGYLRAAEAARQLGYLKEARELTLTHQYGADILTDEFQTQISPKHRDKHTSLIWLVELIWTKVIFNLRSEVHRNYLSYGWWILEPLLHMVVYYMVFGLLLHRGSENYPVFLLTGLIPWMWFLKAVNISSNSIIAGQNLMLQVGIPSVIFPLITYLQSTLKQIPIFILLFGFVWLQGYTPNAHWWALFPVIIVQALLTLAFACAVAAVIPFVRDLAYLVPTGLTFLMFLSGIFYDYRSISREWQELFLMNPIAFLLKSYREILLDGIMPDLFTLALWGFGSVAICLMLLLVYQRLRYIFPRIVME